MTSGNKLLTKADIDWALIERFEGASILKGYVPGAGSGAGKSGVTIATGVDIGQLNNLDYFRSQGVAPELLAKLAPYVGLKGESAYMALAKRPLLITKEESDSLDNAAFRMNVEPWEEYYNKACKAFNKDAPILAELPRGIATILANLCWAFGGRWGQRFPAANRFAVEQNWLALAKELWHWNGVGTTDDQINNKIAKYHLRRGLLLRRREEAKYLGSAINAAPGEIQLSPPRALVVGKYAAEQYSAKLLRSR